MGKISSIAVTLLMVNIIGYLLMASAIEDGYAASGTLSNFNSSQTFLGTLYAPTTYTDEGGSHTVYTLKGTPGTSDDGSLIGSVPTQTPSSFIQQGIAFVDRIFVIFTFIRVMLGVLFFPLALATYIGLPYQLAMLLLAPLTLLYIVGFFDLISGGDN